MPVSTEHPRFESALPQWQRCRDTYNGTDAVKARETAYLPPLSVKHANYASYLIRAGFYPAMGRSVSALTGMVMRRPPVVETTIDTSDLDLRGSNFVAIATEVVRELLITGRVVIALDAIGDRIYWRIYPAESVISWLTDGAQNLLRVVFKESVLRLDPQDEFRFVEADRYRVYTATEEGTTVSLYDDRNNMIFAMVLGNSAGEALQFMPVVFAGGVDPVKPPLLDLADANIGHFQTSGDLDHALHWSASPTPYVSTDGDLPNDMTIGGSTLLKFSKDSTAAMLETSGNGIDGMQARLAAKQEQMAALGARLLNEPNRQAETATAARLRSAGDAATMDDITNTADDALTAALVMHAEWEGSPGTQSVKLNRDFVTASLPPQHVQQLVALLQGGLISNVSFWEALQRGEWVTSERTLEQEQQLIQQTASAATEE